MGPISGTFVGTGACLEWTEALVGEKTGAWYARNRFSLRVTIAHHTLSVPSGSFHMLTIFTARQSGP